MNYNSTRSAALQVTAAQAIAQGISEEGGLFVPQSFPKADLNDMLGLAGAVFLAFQEHPLFFERRCFS